MPLQQFQELRLHHHDTLHQRPFFASLLSGHGRPLQIIEHRQQIAYQRTILILPLLLALQPIAFLIIFKVGCASAAAGRDIDRAPRRAFAAPPIPAD